MGDHNSSLMQKILYSIVNNNEKLPPITQYKAGELLMSGVEDELLSFLVKSPLFAPLVPPTFADGKFRLYPVSVSVKRTWNTT